ncbi:MAG: cell division protein FtsA [Chloroflexi bacterium]|nr:cell division protein FtsA [Chloroflexota bacterium]
MTDGQTFAAIDVGTTKVCALVGELDEHQTLHVVGVGVTPSRGLRKGLVVNVDQAANSIAVAVEQAERLSGYKIDSAVVGVAGSHISSLNSRGIVAITNSRRGITYDDMARALESAQAVAVPTNREIIHVIPREYIIDGEPGIINPLGLLASRLEVEAHIVTGAVSSIQTLINCVHSLGIEISELVLQPLASAEAVLLAEEKEIGCALVDIGGGTTDLAMFVNGSVWHTTIIPVGGSHITNDIAICLRTPISTAEEIKIKYGHAVSAAVESDENIDISAFGERGRQAIARHRLSQVIEARMDEVFALVLREIQRSGYDGLLPAGVILTGGTANLGGICDLGRETLELPVRVGIPRGVAGLVDAIHSPAYATSVGLLLWSQRRDPLRQHAQQSSQSWAGLMARFKAWVRARWSWPGGG